MAKTAKDRIRCEYFVWNLFARHGVFYADGRKNNPSVGKHSLGTKDRDRALRDLKTLDLRKAIECNLATPRPEQDGREIPIQDGWDLHIRHISRPQMMGGAGPTTQKRYRAVRDKHISFCKEVGIESWNTIDKKAVEKYGAWLDKDGYSVATIYLELTLIKQVIKWFIEEEKALPESNRIRLKLQRSLESHTYCPTPQEVNSIIDHCRNNAKLAWLEALVIGMATTGMRIGEIVALRWTDIDLAKGVITLPDNRFISPHLKLDGARTTKGRRSRRIPIHKTLMAVLPELQKRSQVFAFSSAAGNRLKPDRVRITMLKDAIVPLAKSFPTPPGSSGFEHLRPHGFRHFFVSQAFLGGASEGEIREWVGHRDSRIVERYRHLSNDEARRKMDQIEFFGRNNARKGGKENEKIAEEEIKIVA